jgi:hypothetical protein
VGGQEWAYAVKAPAVGVEHEDAGCAHPAIAAVGRHVFDRDSILWWADIALVAQWIVNVLDGATDGLEELDTLCGAHFVVVSDGEDIFCKACRECEAAS